MNLPIPQGGLSFNGTNSYANIGLLGSFGSNIGTGIYIMFQIRASQVSGSNIGGFLTVGGQGIVIAWNTAQNNAFLQNGIKFTLRDSTSTKNLAGGITTPTININDNKLHTIEITATPASNNITITIDGVRQGITYSNQDTPASFANIATNFYLGANNNAGYSNGAKCVLTRFKIGTTKSKLYGDYLFDGGHSNTVIDYSVSTSHGTLSGAVLPIWVKHTPNRYLAQRLRSKRSKVF